MEPDQSPMSSPATPPDRVERRSQPRICVDVCVTVRDSGGRAILCRLREVSPCGALLECDRAGALMLDASAELADPRITLTVVRPPRPGTRRQRISTHARVVHVTPGADGWTLVGVRLSNADALAGGEIDPFVAAIDHGA